MNFHILLVTLTQFQKIRTHDDLRQRALSEPHLDNLEVLEERVISLGRNSFFLFSNTHEKIWIISFRPRISIF
jgi:hypothetical protein